MMKLDRVKTLFFGNIANLFIILTAVISTFFFVRTIEGPMGLGQIAIEVMSSTLAGAGISFVAVVVIILGFRAWEEW
jgi:hypothetical protein